MLIGGIFIGGRFYKNPQQIVPYPYQFKSAAPAIELRAPILIIGDRMGDYFARFKTHLSEEISKNLDRPIEIQSMAKPRHGLHRSLYELNSITRWPEIIIYQGGSEEFLEKKFYLSEISKIKKNFQRFQDPRLQTLLMIYPWISKILYTPVKKILMKRIPEDFIASEQDYFAGLETELLLYREHLNELNSLAQDKGSTLILTTTPINLDAPPKESCQLTTPPELQAKIISVRELLKSGNPKEAYLESSKLLKTYLASAKLFYLNGQIAKRLTNKDEAMNSLLLASAYDCRSWRATEVINSIIREVAQEKKIPLFDYARLVESDFLEKKTFRSDIYPLDDYYKKASKQLGVIVRKMLKL